MNLYHQFDQLGKRQIILQEGIELMKKVQLDFKQEKANASAWGFTAVMANVVLVPLNCIVNAFELKTANDIYKTLVKEAYSKFSKSGSRIKNDNVKTSLSILKKVATDTLKTKGMTAYVPGVNILVGLAEDSVAAWEAISLVSEGEKDLKNVAGMIERNITRTTNQLMDLGKLRSDIHDSIEQMERTA